MTTVAKGTALSYSASSYASGPDRLAHRIDKKGGVYCSCGARFRFRIAFLAPERSAPVQITERCKACHVVRFVFLDRLYLE